MSKLILHICFLFVLVFCPLKSQNLLTLEDAIKTALEKNYSVLISRNQMDVARFQNSMANAGMLPSLSLNANLNLANLNSHQEFNTGTVQDRSCAKSSNLGASVNAVWTVFDGLKMFAIKKRLEQNERMNMSAFKLQVEETVYAVILAYYNNVRLGELIKASKQNLTIFEERKKIAKLKMEIGSDSRVDFLMSQTNENRARSDIYQLELQLLSAMTKLNTLMGRPGDSDFVTNDSIKINYEPKLDELKRDILKSNLSVLVSKRHESILESGIKEAGAAKLPFVQLNAAYNFTRNSSQAGIVFLNQQSGLNGGLSLNWLLLDAGKSRRLIQERRVLTANQQLFTEMTIHEVDALVYIQYKTFLLNRKILDLERQNMHDSRDVLNVTLERYRIGKANLLETIETQKNLEDAQVRYINSLYAMKVSETELLKANGNLLK